QPRASSGAIHERFRGDSGPVCGQAAIVGHRCDELITALRKGSNELRLIAAITEYLAYSQDVLLHDLGVDDGVGPQGFENLVLGDEPLVAVDEIAEQVESLRRQGDALVSAPQALVGRVESERLELFHRGGLSAGASVDSCIVNRGVPPG